MKLLKIIAVISLVLIFTFHSKSCGPYEWEAASYEYQFVYPEKKNFSLYSEMLLINNNAYAYQFSLNAENQNINEWMAYFKNQVKAEDIGKLVYEFNLDEIKNILAYTKNESKLNIPENSLISYCKANQETAFLDYLYYAKKCEKIATKGEEWDPVSADTPITELYNEGETLYKSSSIEFIKLRYAYQLIRIARYAKEYQKALNYHDNLALPLAHVTSEIQFRILEQKAGILSKMDKKAEANILLALIFDRCPTLRYSAFHGIEFLTESDWNQTMEKAQTNREKTTLHFIRAIKPNSIALEEMLKIYLLNPSSDQLELLLIREINRLEYDLLKTDLNTNLLFYEDYRGFPQKEVLEQLKKIREFVMTVLIDKKASSLDFWRLNLAYLDYLSNFKQEAKTSFNQLAANSKNAHIKFQAEVLNFVTELSELKKADRDSENLVFQKLQKLKEEYTTDPYNKSAEQKRYEQLLDYVSTVFHNLYDPKADLAKYYLSDRSFTVLKAKVNPPSIEIWDAAINLFNQKEKNDFEKYLLSKLNPDTEYGYDSNLNASEASQKAFLYRAKGMFLLQQNKVKEALEAFKQVPNPGKYLAIYFDGEKPEVNPFQVEGVYCDICTDEVFQAGKFTQLSLTEALLQLQSKADQSQKADLIKYNLMLGNFYFNLSYYGNCWNAIDHYKSDSGMDYISWIGAKNDEFRDLSIAISHYNKVITLAIKQKDRESAAKAYFMLAVCEEKQSNITGNPFTAFQKLKTDFKNTAYYTYILDECLYFNDFVNKK